MKHKLTVYIKSTRSYSTYIKANNRSVIHERQVRIHLENENRKEILSVPGGRRVERELLQRGENADRLSKPPKVRHQCGQIGAFHFINLSQLPINLVILQGIIDLMTASVILCSAQQDATRTNECNAVATTHRYIIVDLFCVSISYLLDIYRA